MDQRAFDDEVVRRFRSGEPLERMNRDRILLLTTTGRRSGGPRTTPVMALQHDGLPLVVASNDGAAGHPAWFLNLRGEPSVTVETPDGAVTPSRAEELDGEERDRAWREVLEVAPFFADHQERAGARRIPLVVLRPEQ